MQNEIYCNNCGKIGHLYHQCKLPITSIGIVVFRINNNDKPEFLMIRRKDSLGHIDFIRGKYSLNNNKLTTLNELIDESNKQYSWEETEWGFPKGRRNCKETDYDCALREFNEETGYNIKLLQNLQNIIPYEEIFTGSNYKSYKHKYFVMYMSYENSLQESKFEETEVSKMEWKTLNQSFNSIRPYNVEKKRILSKIHKCISENKII